MQSTAVQFSAPYAIELIDVDVPEPRHGETLVRVLFSGISSGTEMLAYRGQIDQDADLDEKLGSLSGTFGFPFRFGYSCVGTVAASGGRLAPGTLVFAFHPHQSHIVVPEQELIELPAVDPRHATLFPLVETALQITLDAGRVAYSVVVVSGLGAVGILTGALLVRAGASVVGLDPEPARRDAAIHFGIQPYVPEEAPDVVRRATSEGVSLAVEASGNPDALRSLLGLLAHEGTVLVASWYGSRPVELPLGGAFHRRRITIRSTQVSTIPADQSSSWTLDRRRKAATALLAQLDLGILATHQFPISNASEAFASVDKGGGGLIHAALAYEKEI